MMRLHLNLPSTSLLRPVEIRLALPYGFSIQKPPYRVIWALHCAMSDGGIFFESLDATDIVDREQAALVAPSLGNGYFLNSPFERQADFLQEMLEALRDLFPFSQRREDNMVVGISMGGFGAVRWALESGAFGKAVAISGVFDCRIPLDERMKYKREQRAFHATFVKLMRRIMLNEEGEIRPDADIDLLLRKAALLPDIDLYCADEDYLSLPQTLRLKELCDQYNCTAQLRISHGGHDTTYWKQILPKAMAEFFHIRNTSIQEEAICI